MACTVKVHDIESRLISCFSLCLVFVLHFDCFASHSDVWHVVKSGVLLKMGRHHCTTVIAVANARLVNSQAMPFHVHTGHRITLAQARNAMACLRYKFLKISPVPRVEECSKRGCSSLASLVKCFRGLFVRFIFFQFLKAITLYILLLRMVSASQWIMT